MSFATWDPWIMYKYERFIDRSSVLIFILKLKHQSEKSFEALNSKQIRKIFFFQKHFLKIKFSLQDDWS